MSLRNNLEYKAETEKTADAPRWNASYDPFCVDDTVFDIRQLHLRYQDFARDVNEYDRRAKWDNDEHTASQQRFNQTIRLLKKSLTQLGHLFTQFRELHAAHDNIKMCAPHLRATLITIRNKRSSECFSTLLQNLLQQQKRIQAAAEHMADPKKLLKADQALVNLGGQINQLRQLQPTTAAVQFALAIFRTPAYDYRDRALSVITAYKRSLGPLNYYGKKRADELAKMITSTTALNNPEAMKTVIAQFIKDGKTDSDHSILSFFRSPTRSSGVSAMSLRGMMINEFMPRTYYKTAAEGLRIVNIRSLLQHNVDSIKGNLTSPLPANYSRSSPRSASTDIVSIGAKSENRRRVTP